MNGKRGKYGKFIYVGMTNIVVKVRDFDPVSFHKLAIHAAIDCRDWYCNELGIDPYADEPITKIRKAGTGKTKHTYGKYIRVQDSTITVSVTNQPSISFNKLAMGAAIDERDRICARLGIDPYDQKHAS